MKASTMRELLVQAEETWGEEIVIRYKSGLLSLNPILPASSGRDVKPPCFSTL